MALLVLQDVVGQPVDAPLTLDRLPPRRRRLSSVVGRYADRSRPFMVSISRPGQALMPADDTVVPRADWRRTLVPRDATVVITYIPMGGGGGSGGRGGQGKAIGGALAMIALAVVAPYAIGALGGVFGSIGALTTVGKIAAAGIVMGGGYLISKATQAKANKQDSNSEPLYGVSGGGNMPQPGGRIPVGYGRFWTQPDLSQPDYIINDGEDQILYKRMTLGLGEYDVEEIRVGGAVLWTAAGGVHSTFAGAEVEIINPGGTSNLVPGSVISSSNVAGAEIARFDENPSMSGPYPVTPAGATTKRIQIDWTLPNCFMNWKKDGRQLPCPYEVRFQYAPIDANDNPTAGWSELYSSGAMLDTTRAQRYTVFKEVPEGRYAVRAFNNMSQYHYDQYGESQRYNAVTWDGLRSVNQETITRPHVTEIAVKIRSGKTLAATTLSDIWVRATRKLPVWNGSAWVTQPTRKAVWAWCDVMRSAYGGNLLDSQIDAARALHYATTLTELDTFDGIIRGPVSVHEAASTVLGVIRADPVRIGNTWSIGRDEPRAVAKHLFTRRQIVRDSSQAQFQVSRDDGQADVIVEYYQDSDSRRRREARATFGAASLTPRRYSAAGVSTYEHAHHLATWMAAAAYYRRERRTITVEHEGRLVSRGDPARVDVWYMSDAVAAGVMAQDGYTITLDTDVDAAGKYAIFRSRRNREWGPVAVSQGSNAHTIVLHGADVAAAESSSGLSLGNICDDNGGDMPSVLIGPLTELQEAYIVDSATPQGRDRVTIEAVRDSDAVWTAIGQAVPPEPDIPSRGDMDAPAVPVIPWLRAVPVQKTNALDMEWSLATARGAVRYVVSLTYDDGTTWERVSDGPSTSGTYTLRYVEDVAVRVAAYAVNAEGVTGPEVYATFDTFMPSASVGENAIDFENLSEQIRYEISLITREGKAWLDWLDAYFDGQKPQLPDGSSLDFGSMEDMRRQMEAALERLAAAEATTSAKQHQHVELVKVEMTKGDVKNFAAIEDEKVARIAEDEALAAVSTTIVARLDDPDTGLEASAVAIDTLETRVTTAEGGIEAISQKTTILESEVIAPFTARYTWDFLAGYEGFTAGGATLTHDPPSGVMAITNAGSPYPQLRSPTGLSINGMQNRIVRARIRRTAGSGPFLGTLSYVTAARAWDYAYRSQAVLPEDQHATWSVVEWDMTIPAAGQQSDWFGSTITQLRFDLSRDADAKWQIDWISIGDKSGVTAGATAVEELKTRVTVTEDGVEAVSTKAVQLESRIDDPNTGLSATANAVQGLETRVTLTEDSISSQASAITGLEAAVEQLGGSGSGNASAIQALTVRVTATESGIDAHTTAITGLQAAIDDLEGGGSGNASAIQALTARVESVEGEITSTAQDVTVLQAEVNDQTGTLTNLAEVVAGPNGLTAQWGVALDLGAGVQGGFKLTGARRNDGSGGTVKLIVDGDMLLNGTFTAEKLVANQVIIQSNLQMGGNTVGTPTILSNAVTQSYGSEWYWDNNSSGDTPAIELTTRQDARMAIICSFHHNNPNAVFISGINAGFMTLYIDEVANMEVPVYRAAFGDGSGFSVSGGMLLATPLVSAGFHYFRIRHRERGANFPGWWRMTVMELAR